LEIQAANNYVILRLEKVKEVGHTKSGILLVNKDEKYNAYIDSIGTNAKVEGFKIGDNVIFNEYDKKVVEINEKIYVILKDISIMAVVD